MPNGKVQKVSEHSIMCRFCSCMENVQKLHVHLCTACIEQVEVQKCNCMKEKHALRMALGLQGHLHGSCATIFVADSVDGSECHKLYEFVPLSKQNYYIILGHKYSMGSIRLNICRPRENPELV